MTKIALRKSDACQNSPHQGSQTYLGNGRIHALGHSTGQTEARRVAETSVTHRDISGFDSFVKHEGLRFAGTHLILDLWEASNLDDLEAVEDALRQATEAAGATLLNIDLHSFTPTGGITGVAILAESHISIHTWPEHSYAAIDIFMCGEAKPYKAIDVLKLAFTPEKLTVVEHKRGLVP